MPENQNPLIYRMEDNVAFIEINRPETKNALNFRCWQLLDKYLEKIESSRKIRALIITGHGEKMFSAGFDINPSDKFMLDMFKALQEKDNRKLDEGFAYIQTILLKLAHLPIPTIAAINGACYSGGLELALACDIRVVRENTVLCFQETRLGLIPDLGGSVRLARLVGPGRAKDLVFSARKIMPGEAKEMGLINHVFPEKSFMADTMDYVKKITENCPGSLKAVKDIIDETVIMDEKAAMVFEREKAVENVLRGDCVEGIGAFLEKRVPRWSE